MSGVKRYLAWTKLVGIVGCLNVTPLDKFLTRLIKAKHTLNNRLTVISTAVFWRSAISITQRWNAQILVRYAHTDSPHENLLNLLKLNKIEASARILIVGTIAKFSKELL